MGALWIGFTGLLLLMAVLAIDSSRQLRNVAETSAALRKESREHDDLLDQLRFDIFRSGTIIRDYLLEGDDARAKDHKASLEQLREHNEEILKSYEHQLSGSEKTAFKDLRNHVESYWDSFTPAMQWTAEVRRRQKSDAYLRDVVIPRRHEAVQLVRHVTAINEQILNAAEEQLETMQSGFRKRTTVISVFALILGVILAGIIIHRVQRLENEAAARYREVEAARAELENLSSRLLTFQEEERRNLSRELHDEIGQAMSAMLVELGRLETAQPSQNEHREQIASIRKMAESSVGAVRNMALLLRPSMLDDLGLLPALNWQAREVMRRSKLKVKLTADEKANDLPDEYRTCIYRIVQEALNNCAKHAKATLVRVTVHQDENGLGVLVQDDGIGLDPHRDKGMGLLGMEERVKRLGGTFRIDSHPGSGAALSAYFPQTRTL